MLRQRLRRIHQPDSRPARARAGSAGRAGSRRLGAGGVAEEAAVAPQRRAHPAHRPAVDAGRGDADEQPAVEARVVGLERQVGGVGIEGHAADYGQRAAGRWPFSDMPSGWLDSTLEDERNGLRGEFVEVRRARACESSPGTRSPRS